MKNFHHKLFLVFLLINTSLFAQLQNSDILNEPPDVSEDFSNPLNTFFIAGDLVSFDPVEGRGRIQFNRHNLATRMAFNNMLLRLVPAEANEFPSTEYEVSPEHPFYIQFISDQTVRIKLTSGPQFHNDEPSIMLVDGKVNENKSSWKYTKIEGGHQYESSAGKLVITESPWHIYLYDENGRLLTQSIHSSDVSNTFTPVVPFSYIRRSGDYSRSMNAVLSLSPGEKIFGCGESFQSFDKRGEKVILWTDDPNGVQNETMYKPVPFFMSNRGYGIFMHHSSPITCDFGKYFSGVNSMMIGDDELDLFIFLGSPKEILNEYTNLTGKAAMPPLWSFGFWMSRITYFSQAEGLQIAKKLRDNQIPADVLHFDTGWFGTDWRNDYVFASDRFPDPEKMISQLDKMGFKVSLWQLPYFTPKNSLFNEVIEKELVVRDRKGNIPYEDAVLDFSNETTVSWYQDKIGDLFNKGVGVIKVDFGEAAPAEGIYNSGKTGFYEHNLYPLRYNKAVADITEQKTGYPFIWARSAWAGSQRYPVHWGGDPATSNTAMAATLRGGLSLGLSGFTFWSHDIGGFVTATPEDLYRRWTPFGMLTSHVRSHGAPPTEPWEYGQDFISYFRKADNMRYRLMPYIYTQAKHSSENGLPMVRALFIEYPGDPGSWLIDDQYLFGSDILVAPLFESEVSRDVYLPPGKWFDYQTGKVYENCWHNISSDELSVIMLVKEGSIIPHIKLAQSTKEMDWSEIELKVFNEDHSELQSLLFLPGQKELQTLILQKVKDSYTLKSDPYKDQVKWKINVVNNNF